MKFSPVAVALVLSLPTLDAIPQKLRGFVQDQNRRKAQTTNPVKTDPEFSFCKINVSEECPDSLMKGEIAKCGSTVIGCATPVATGPIGCAATSFIQLHSGENLNGVSCNSDDSSRRGLIDNGFYTIPEGKERPGDIVEFGFKIENSSGGRFLSDHLKTEVTVDTQTSQEPVKLRDDYGVFQSYSTSNRGENRVELNYVNDEGYWGGSRSNSEHTTFLFDATNACSAQNSEYGSLIVDFTAVAQLESDDCVDLGEALGNAAGFIVAAAVGGLFCAVTAGIGCAAVVVGGAALVGAPLGAVVGAVAGQEICEAELTDGLDSEISLDLSPIWNGCLKGGVNGDVQITALEGDAGDVYPKGVGTTCAMNAASGEGTCHITLPKGFAKGSFLVETNLYRDA